MHNLIINIPVFFDIIIIRKNEIIKIIIKNNNIVFNIFNYKIEYKKYFYINRNTNSCLVYKKKNLFFIKNEIENYIKMFNLFLFIKIKFKGKGYKIKINSKKKKINFYFNHSHPTLLLLKKIIIKNISKNKFLILNKNYMTLKNISFLITNIKKLNLYTIRGLRNSKQIIIKRRGKKNSSI